MSMNNVETNWLFLLVDINDKLYGQFHENSKRFYLLQYCLNEARIVHIDQLDDGGHRTVLKGSFPNCAIL